MVTIPEGIHLSYNTYLTISGALDESVIIPVEMAAPGVFAKGGETYTITQKDVANFTSINKDYGVRLNANNELELFEKKACMVSLLKHQLSLGSDIGVIFRVKIPSSIAGDIHPVFVYKDKEEAADLGSPIFGTKDEYKVMYRVPAKEMGNLIGLKFEDGDGNVVGFLDKEGTEFDNGINFYSVIDYCDELLLQVGNDPAYAELVDLVIALQNYGHYAQAYFKSGDTLPALIGDNYLDSVSASDFAGYDVERSGDEIGIFQKTMSLILKSTTIIRHRFVLEEGHDISEYTFTCGDRVLDAVPVGTDGKEYFIFIDGIVPQKLDFEYTLVVTSDA